MAGQEAPVDRLGTETTPWGPFLPRGGNLGQAGEAASLQPAYLAHAPTPGNSVNPIGKYTLPLNSESQKRHLPNQQIKAKAPLGNQPQPNLI